MQFERECRELRVIESTKSRHFRGCRRGALEEDGRRRDDGSALRELRERGPRGARSGLRGGRCGFARTGGRLPGEIQIRFDSQSDAETAKLHVTAFNIFPFLLESWI